MIIKSTNMESKEFKEVLETIKSGTPFTAKVSQHGEMRDLVGKVHILDHQFFLCYNEGQDGDKSPDRHGYKYSWSVTRNNMDCIKTINFTPDQPVSKEPIVINDYQIY